MGSTVQLLLASENVHKREELAGMLAPLGVRVLAPHEVGGLPEVVEDQPTFEGNAIKKAQSGARATGHWCLADDSGLEVEILGGAPGVQSARFAGAHGDDAANLRLLLERLDGYEEGDRAARFVCVLALARPDGELAADFRGTVRGRILHEPRGESGFGYDPVFLFTEPGHPQTDRGFAELTAREKAEVSHRGRALRELARRLPELFAADRA